MEKEGKIPENALTLNDCFDLLAKLELIGECINYVKKDTKHYIDGEEITYCLDFPEIFPILFPVSVSKEKYFKEINQIWSGILPFKISKKELYNNINYTLLPGTIFEFYREFFRRYEKIAHLKKRNFKL